jgi:hypothetical protein
MKKASSGDASAMQKAVTLMTQAQKLADDIEKISDKLTPAQEAPEIVYHSLQIPQQRFYSVVFFSPRLLRAYLRPFADKFFLCGGFPPSLE